MSPLQQLELAFKQRFPRVSGDEPFIDGMWAGIKSVFPA